MAEQTITKQGYEKENKSVVASTITAGQPADEVTRPFPCLEREEKRILIVEILKLRNLKKNHLVL